MELHSVERAKLWPLQNKANYFALWVHSGFERSHFSPASELKSRFDKLSWSSTGEPANNKTLNV